MSSNQMLDLITSRYETVCHSVSDISSAAVGGTAADVRKEIDTTLSEEDLKDLADIAKMIELKKYEGVKEVVQRSVRVYNELLKAGYMVDKTAGNAEGPGFWTIRW